MTSIETRISLLEDGQKRHGIVLDRLDKSHSRLCLEFRVLKTRLAVYASLGAAIGGIVSAVIVDRLARHG